MTSQMNVKVRVVRCPRCSKLLPEMAEVPVYQCGGCGAVLKAKNRKTDTKDIEPHRHETDPAQESDREHVSEDKGPGSLNQQMTVPLSDESVVDKSSEERDPDDSGGHNGEQISGVNHSDELRSSTELTRHENAGSSPVARSDMEANEDSPLNQHERREEDDFGDKNFSAEASSSSEPSCHENESSSPLAGAHVEVNESKFSSTEPSCHGNEPSSPLDGAHVEVNASKLLEQNDERYQSEFGEDTEVDENLKSRLNQHERRDEDDFGDKNFSAEASSSSEPSCHENESSSPLAGAHVEVNASKLLEQNDERYQSEFGEDTGVDENLKYQSEFGEDTEVDENLNSRFISKSSSDENLLYSSRMNSFATAQRSFADSIFSDNFGSPPKEQMKQGQNGIRQALEHVSSTDTLEDIPRVSPSSELGVTLGDISKSPTTESHYAYYGSESSCNENEYHVPGRHFHAPRRNFKDKGLVSPKGLPQRDEFMRKHNATKGSKSHRDEFSEPTRHAHPVRSMMISETNEHVRTVPFYSRGFQAGPSTYGHNKFQHNSMYHSSDEHERPESSKVELLKMVCELQDQLDRKYSSIDAANGRYPLRRGEGKNWSQPCKVNRMAFSGEAGHFRHQVDCSCLRCLPQERHYSAQLPRHLACSNNRYYMAHPSPNYYSSHHSGSSSPIQYTGSEFSSWSCDNDPWHKDRELKTLNLREKHQPVKRHTRPVAGGSPIIECYQCSALLQLPADFLFFKRRCHQLQCSACLKVLKFSLQNRIHLVRYLPDAIAPPSSEIDDYTDSIKKRNLALASASHASEPISCSVDYGLSSTEGDPFSSLIPPFPTCESHSDDRKMSSVSSFEPMEERKRSLLRESKNKYKNQSSGSRQSSGSPLHRLMGYSSPSKVWRVGFGGLRD